MVKNSSLHHSNLLQKMVSFTAEVLPSLVPTHSFRSSYQLQVNTYNIREIVHGGAIASHSTSTVLFSTQSDKNLNEDKYGTGSFVTPDTFKLGLLHTQSSCLVLYPTQKKVEISPLTDQSSLLSVPESSH